LDDLANFVGNPKTKTLLDEVTALSQVKLSLLDTNIQLVRSVKTDEAILRIRDDTGELTMDKIRSAVRKIDGDFRRELRVSSNESWRSFIKAITLASVALLISLTLIVISFVRVGRELALRNRTDQLQQKRTIQLQSFADIAYRIVTCPDVDSIVGIALNEFRILIGTKEAILKFRFGETVRVEQGFMASGTQHSKADYLKSIFELIQVLGAGERAFFRHRTDILSNSVATSSPAWEACGDSVESILSAPLLNLHREEIGRFVLIGKLEGEFNQNDLSIVAQLAFILSAAIEITRLTELASQAAIRKDEFLAMLGHELRNPLAGVLTGSEAMLREPVGSANPDTKLLLESVHRQACMMQYLIDDLLDVSRIGQGKVTLNRSDCNITAVIRHAVRDQQELYPSRTVILEGSDETASVVVFGDQTRLSQCITNLLNNACKFSAAEDSILVKVSHIGRGDLSCDSISIVVMDHGIGLDPEELKSIFDLFYQSNDTIDRSQGGLGIGLTLAKGLIEMHGGRLTASSPGRDQGSSFTIQLPVKLILKENDNGSLPSSVHSEIIESSIKPIRILAIDDRADALLPIRVLMTRDGHQVSESHDGKEGIQMAKAIRPDLILCDIGLPGLMTGYDVAQAIRSDPDLKNTYLVALSGYSQPSDRKRAQTAGFDFHVAKPIKLSMLRNLVANRPKF